MRATYNFHPRSRNTRTRKTLVTAAAQKSGLRFACVGISHRTADPELRGRAGFPAESLRDALAAARHDPRIQRLAIVSTCHRTELYAETPSTVADPHTTLLQWWADRRMLGTAILTSHTYALAGEDAERHLLRVAAGLDSVVLGEAQIVGQVASSLRQSIAVHAASPLLKLEFRSAVRTGERARRAVWGRLQAASLGSAAIDAAAAATGGLRGRTVLVVGAGEIAELAVRALAAHSAGTVIIANRGIDAARAMAARHGAQACSLAELPFGLRNADVVITATRAAQILIGPSLITAVMQQRSARPMTIVDVSLPRNVDVGVQDVAGARLIGIDDLASYTASMQPERRAMMPVVERIVTDELDALHERLARRAVGPFVFGTGDHGTTLTEAHRPARIAAAAGANAERATMLTA